MIEIFFLITPTLPHLERRGPYFSRLLTAIHLREYTEKRKNSSTDLHPADLNISRWLLICMSHIDCTCLHYGYLRMYTSYVRAIIGVGSTAAKYTCCICHGDMWHSVSLPRCVTCHASNIHQCCHSRCVK